MFRRGLAVLLCSALLAGSLPETSFAAEAVETVETAETETAGAEEAEPENQENDASTESGEAVQASQTTAPETQTASGTEQAKTEETTKTETTVVEATEDSTTEGKTDASEGPTETETQIETATAVETETTSAVETETATQTETVSAVETETVTETTTETEETTTIVETEEATTEVETEESENADGQASDTLGNEYVAVSNVKVAYNSISFDYEIKNDNVRYLYVNNFKSGQNIEYNTNGSITINGLSPSTEYNLYFTGYSPKERFYEFSQTTAECPYNVKYEVTSAEANAINLSAEITAKEGAQYELPEQFTLNWKCFDENGKEISDLAGFRPEYVSGDSLPVKITGVVEDPQYIFENTKYTFELWISESRNYDVFGFQPQYAKESNKEVTTPKSVVSGVDITFTPDKSDSSVVHYTVSTGDYKDSVEGAVFFRQKGNNVWSEAYHFSTENGSATGELYGLALGSTYEYMVNAAGCKKTDEFPNGEAKLKWDASYDMGALDAVVTFKLDDTTKTEGATYEVYGEYKRHESNYWDDYSLAFEQGEDNAYTAVARYMRPNTQYDVRINVYESLPNGGENRYVALETVTTKPSAVKTNINRTYLDAVRFDVAFDDSVRTTNLEDSVEVYPYVKGEDGKYTLLENSDGLWLYGNEFDGESSIIYGLESNKAYEISFGYLDEETEDKPYYEYGTMTFKTGADDRTISIDTPEAGVSGVTINGTLKGSAVPYEGATYIYLLCKESGTDKWLTLDTTDVYIDEDEQSSEIEEKFTLSTTDLESGKSYEYAVGIGNGDAQDINSLRDVKKGTIKTRPDERSVEVTDTISLLDSLVIKAKLTGKYIDNYNHYNLYYREKKDGATPWLDVYTYGGLSFNGDSRETFTTINERYLTSGTTYEYKICGGNSRPKTEEAFAALPGGEFKYEQPKDDRKAEATVTAKCTSAEVAITLTGSARAFDNYINVFCREKGSTYWGYSKAIHDIRWNEDDPTSEMTIGRLIVGKEYEYAVVISNEYLSYAPENTEKTGEFTTTDARKFVGEAVTTLDGYNSVNLSIDVEGFTGEGLSYIFLYYKEQNADWRRINKWVSSDGNVTINSVPVEPNKTYDYSLVIADDSYNPPAPGSEAYDKLTADKKKIGTFAARKSTYALSVTPNAEMITYDQGAFDVEVTDTEGFAEKNFRVRLAVTDDTGNYPITATGNINSVDKKGQVVVRGLLASTKYKASATLEAYVTGKGWQTVAIKEGIEFSTIAMNAPTALQLSETEIYLNSLSYLYNRQVVRVNVPEDAAKGTNWAVEWSSDKPEVASVNAYGTIVAREPGEATITATSLLNENAKATVKVHVEDYSVVLLNEAGTGVVSIVSAVSTVKNTVSTNAKVSKISVVAGADGNPNYRFDRVDAKGVSDNPSIAYWDDAEQSVVANNIGSTNIVLTVDDKYKTELNVSVYAEKPKEQVPDFDLKIRYDDEMTYPAIKTSEGYQIAIGEDYRLFATTASEIEGLEDISEVLSYKVSEADASVLGVYQDYYGAELSGLKKGTATVTVSYDLDKVKALLQMDPYNVGLQQILGNAQNLPTKTVKFDVRQTASQGLPTVHAITNVHETLKEAVSTLGEGWKLLDPDTPLYTLPVNNSKYSYDFEAEYTGNDFYPYKGKVKVYLSTIAGVNVINNGSSVISGDGEDAMHVVVRPVITGYTGIVEDEDYKVVLTSPKPDVKVESDAAGFKITATKKGKYTLKADITNKDGSNVFATGSYAITVADGTLIDHIDLEPSAESEHVTIVGNTIYFDSEKMNDVKSFKLAATAFDRKEAANTTTKLLWTTTDKTVADIDAKADDRAVTVNIKGEGHAVIQVTAGDDAKASAKFNVEVRNYKPRVEGDKATINTAYDYNDSYGIYLSGNQYGVISVTAVYSDTIKKIQVMDGDKASTNFKIAGNDSYGDRTAEVIIAPVNADMAAGKHTANLAVTTASGFTYTYPLAITVMNKEPKVTAKVSNSMNLFYINNRGQLDITLEKNKSKDTDYSIESIRWGDSSDEAFRLNGSTYLPKTPNVKRYWIDGSKVKVSDGKLVNPNAASSTVSIKLQGVRKSYELPVTVKCSYKKPKLTTADIRTGKNTSMIIPSLSAKSFGFYILGDKKALISYSELRVNSDIKNDVTISGSYPVNVAYYGTAEKFDLPLTVDSYNWREALTVTHKVAVTNPVAVLSNAKLTYNTNYDGAVYTQVMLKDYGYQNISFVDVTGADEVSHNLLASGKIQTSYVETEIYGYMLKVKLNASKLDTIPKAATYVLTPYCNGKALNTLTLKISFTDKAVTAKASGKGKLDLAISDAGYFTPEGFVDYDPDSNEYKWLIANSIAVAPKFANLGSGYYVTGAELTGEYRKYFDIYRSSDSKGNSVQYIKISENGKGKLKAGQNYNLSVIYTLQDDEGNRITVQSNVMKIKPIQKAPKITIIGDNQILYAAAPDVEKTTIIRTPYYDTDLTKDYYMIQSAYGSLDTNKDGKADIVISSGYDSEGSSQAELTVRLTDKDAVITAAKGKTYTVPVTVKLVGRDGIAKDAAIKIKVTVKR